MICPTCQQEIPDSASGHPLLGCPTCMAERSYRGLLNFERQFVAGMRRGEIPLTLAKPTRQFRWHLMLAPYLQAWCGAPIGGQWDRKRRTYPAIDQRATPLCADCLRVFETLEEEHTEVA